MTNAQIELLTVLYALTDCIEAKDWATAGVMVEHLLNLVSPLAPPIATDLYPTQKENHGPEIRH